VAASFWNEASASGAHASIWSSTVPDSEYDTRNSPLVLLDHVEDQRVHRQVAALGDALQDALVLAVVEVALLDGDVEERVVPQAVRLVDWK
jgi:hypothetical protein